MESTVSSSSRREMVLPLVSMATFWLLPYSPFIAIAAVSKTKNSIGLPRKLAVASAVLCTGYTIALLISIAAIVLREFWPRFS